MKSFWNGSSASLKHSATFNASFEAFIVRFHQTHLLWGTSFPFFSLFFMVSSISISLCPINFTLYSSFILSPFCHIICLEITAIDKSWQGKMPLKSNVYHGEFHAAIRLPFDLWADCDSWEMSVRMFEVVWSLFVDRSIPQQKPNLWKGFSNQVSWLVVMSHLILSYDSNLSVNLAVHFQSTVYETDPSSEMLQ